MTAPPTLAAIRAAFGLAAGVGVLAAPVRAADLGAILPRPAPAVTQMSPDTPVSPDTRAASGTWIVTLTATAQALPRYPGASDYTAVGYPAIDIRRADEPRRFAAPDDGFSLSLYDDATLRIGPTARFVPGRHYGDDRRHLFGFRDARVAVEPGVFVEVYPTPALRTRFEVRQGVYGHHGTVGSVGADYLLPTGAFLFSIGPRLNIGDDGFARTYFGVSPAEAALNGRVQAYDPSNFFSAGILGAVTYTQSATWAYTAFAGYSRIVGPSGDSPLVRRPFGNPDQFQFGLKIDYAFPVRTPS